ncbi:MAG: hypothetical protein JSV96_16085 [Candidatus Aminicenantes bacterium]|nr:MAG: hypothetical protein JSV96_16085 [Candidatus Aminicenantes bacterium]
MKKMAGMLTVFLLILSTLSAEEPKYTNSSIVRLSYVTGNTYIQRAADLGYEEGIVNMPIAEGDRLGTADGRAEIFLGNRNYVRLDKNTKIDILNLPKREYDLTRIRIWSGNAYFNVKFLEKEKDIEIHTSDASLYVLSEGLYRIDVRENRETEIFVFYGLLEAAGETDSVLIKDEHRIEAIEGSFTSRPSRFYAVAEDSFDRWNERRDSLLTKRLAKRYLPGELEDFEYELSAHGDWVYLRPYGWVWIPGGVALDWRPYYHGRWTWVPMCGWTWIPYEPWGWCVSHYGRWHWRVGLGWYWIPTRHWGPAWVSWYWGYDYFAWAPMSYYGYPAVVINNVFYGRYRGSYYPYYSRALTVIHKNQLKAKNISKVALGRESVKKIGKFNLSRKPPSVKPKVSKLSVEKLKNKKLLLRKSNRPSETERVSRLSKRSIKKSTSLSTKEIKKSSTRNLKSSKESKVSTKKTEAKVKKKVSSSRSSEYTKKESYRNPSSSKTSKSKSINKVKSSKGSSVLGKVRKFISSAKSIKSSSSRGSSRGSSSKSVKSSSKSSSSSSRKSSSSSSSSRSASKSGKVKKKK